MTFRGRELRGWVAVGVFLWSTAVLAVEDGPLRTGENLYRDKAYAAALDHLRAARRSDPQNPEAALFEGLADIRLDRPAEAAAAWGDFARTSKDRKLAADVARYRTILLHEANERAAKAAVGRERELASAATDPRTVAVAGFQNLGTSEYAPLGKALAAMLIDNLAALPGITVLEREQVEALVAEANLAASGLVQKATAVRAGKLLRAGRVTAGSHVDWTASPAHLRIEALLVDVDRGEAVAESKSEAMAADFFTLVPAIAREFASALERPVTQLPPASRQRLEQPHTRSLPAVLYLGRALEAEDRKDFAAALQFCKLVEREDPNFELAKRKCAFLPATWLSLDAVAVAVEPAAFELAGLGPAGGSYLVPAVIGALVVGGAAGGAAAALSGGGGGHAEDPKLEGVTNKSVAAGGATTLDLTCTDPQGTSSTITLVNPGPGTTFQSSSGNPATAGFRFQSSPSDDGSLFAFTFRCADSGKRPSATIKTAKIAVTASKGPLPTPTSTPTVCSPINTQCTQASQCCSAGCATISITNFPGTECCVPPQGTCATATDCCDSSGSGMPCDLTVGRCCKVLDAPCVTSSECCSNNCQSFCLP